MNHHDNDDHYSHKDAHYIEPDYYANNANRSMPILSTVGRGPRGDGVDAEVIASGDDVFVYRLYNDVTGETILQSPNLSAGVLKVSQTDANPKEGIFNHAVFTLTRGGVPESFDVTIPSGSTGSRVYTLPGIVKKEKSDIYRWKELDLTYDSHAEWASKPKPRVYDIVMFNCEEDDLAYLAVGEVKLVEDGQVLVTTQTYIAITGITAKVPDGYVYVKDPKYPEALYRNTPEGEVRVDNIEVTTARIDQLQTESITASYDVETRALSGQWSEDDEQLPIKVFGGFDLASHSLSSGDIKLYGGSINFLDDNGSIGSINFKKDGEINVGNINLTTINNAVYPPPVPELPENLVTYKSPYLLFGVDEIEEISVKNIEANSARIQTVSYCETFNGEFLNISGTAIFDEEITSKISVTTPHIYSGILEADTIEPNNGLNIVLRGDLEGINSVKMDHSSVVNIDSSGNFAGGNFSGKDASFDNLSLKGELESDSLHAKVLYAGEIDTPRNLDTPIKIGDSFGITTPKITIYTPGPEPSTIIRYADIETVTFYGMKAVLDKVLATESIEGAADLPLNVLRGVNTPNIDTTNINLTTINGAAYPPVLSDGVVTEAKLAAAVATKLNKPGYSLPTATTAILGGVKPDGTSVTVNASGVLSAVSQGIADGAVTEAKLAAAVATKLNKPDYSLPVATTTILGGVKPDGTTITANAGILSATPFVIADKSIATAKLADSAITTLKIANASITKEKLAPGAIVMPPHVATYDPTRKCFYADNEEINLIHSVYMVTQTLSADILQDCSSVTTNILNVSERAVFGETIEATGDISAPGATFENINITTINGAAYPPAIADKSITTPKIANAAVGALQIADNSITETELSPELRSKIDMASNPYDYDSVYIERAGFDLAPPFKKLYDELSTLSGNREEVSDMFIGYLSVSLSYVLDDISSPVNFLTAANVNVFIDRTNNPFSAEMIIRNLCITNNEWALDDLVDIGHDPTSIALEISCEINGEGVLTYSIKAAARRIDGVITRLTHVPESFEADAFSLPNTLQLKGFMLMVAK